MVQGLVDDLGFKFDVLSLDLQFRVYVQGLELMFQGLDSKVQGLQLMFQGLGSKVQGLELMIQGLELMF